ncbi:related to PRP38A - pre-mRNA-splicing factor [Melanopsichium pennsylvanicum]|uniref:Pre-mRNA-splicing factor 38 n=2 Tax=Melanopsichium pennsylvanicum TaxID=63383 RepID=A0AAJ4XRB4_9BASI|nr:related to PRP38A-pre-mRNA-splicing factor [Melanopsichium pennsylvanicum 4]SNX87034.1 related to PRP38A - pre-mRNA-splicing factor [Melanopsichium pennsylvanicum]
MANATIRNAISIHGTNPQHLIEKPVRHRIYESPFWKEHCFALSASTILPLAVDLHHIGGLVGLQRPSHFLCLLQKLLQIQPESSIINAYLEAHDFKYLRALTAFYVRLTYGSKHVYSLLEPMLADGRKLRWRRGDGGYEVLHVDEWVDQLLTEERVCDIILPRLTKRDVCETRDGLSPRISLLEADLLKAMEKGQNDDAGKASDSDASDTSMSDVKRWKLERLQQATLLSKLQQHQDNTLHLDRVEDIVYTSQEESDEEGGARKRGRFVSPTPSVSPDRQLPPISAEKVQGEQGEQEQGDYVSRSPSRSPDRELVGYVSRSPSRSPDRLSNQEDGEEGELSGYVSRSPSRSPDRL